MKFDDVYKPLFRYDSMGIIWSGNDVHALDVDCDSDLLCFIVGVNVISLLNGDEGRKFEGLSIRADKSECSILQHGEPFLTIRGWGYLTSLGLEENTAAQLQEEFAQWVLHKISKD